MPDAPVLPDASPTTPGPPRRALLAIFLIIFTDFLGFGIIIPMLPFFVPEYWKHPLKVTLLFSIFSICQFIGAPILGALSDRFGRKPILAISQFGSALGYILLGVATLFVGANPTLALTLVYISRVIDGFTGGNVSTAQAYIADVTTEQNRAKGMGLIGAAFGIGFSAGPAIGGIAGYYISPATPAYIAAALAAIAAVATVAYLPESRARREHADMPRWFHPGQFLTILRRPALLQMQLVAFISMAAFVMMESTIGLYLIKLLDWEELQVGWFFAWAGLWIIIIQGGLIGRLTRRFGEWPLSIAGPILVGLGMVGLVAVDAYRSLALLLVAGAVNAIGRSLQTPTLSSLLSRYSERHEQGAVFGLFHGLNSLARIIGPIVAGLVYSGHHTLPYIVATVIVIVAALWMSTLRVAYPTPDSVRPKGFPIAEAARTEIE